MGDITITLTRDEVIYLENLILMDKLDNVRKMAENGYNEESANYIKIDEKLFDKLRKAWKQALQALENDDVDSYTRRMEISDYRA